MHSLEPDIKQRFRRTLQLAVGIIICFGFLSCGDDDVEESVKFALLVRNNTSTDYNIYGQTDAQNTGFSLFGIVRAGFATSVTNLVINADYTFRLSSDFDPSTFDFETTVKSGGMDESWTIP